MNWIVMDNMVRKPSLRALWVSVLLSGCAVGPNFHHPHVPKIRHYTEKVLPAATVSSSTIGGNKQVFHLGKKIPKQWWTVFHSRALNKLIEESIHANPDMKAAAAALKVAHAQTMIQRTAFLPALTGNYNPVRQLTAGTLSSNLSSNAYLYTLTTENLSVSYLPDVFGGTRRQVESTAAQEEAALFQCEAIYVTLTSNVVLAAIQEASLRKQIAVTNHAIASAKKLYELVKQENVLGDIGMEDVAAQAALLAQIEASLPPLRLQLAQNRHLLASLSGRYSSESLSETFTLSDFVLPQALPVSLPAKLVAHRPDIRAAEAQLHAASAQIGVAVANRLPNITLSGNGGYLPVTQSINSIPYFLGFLPLGPSLFWSLGGNLAGTLFDAGSLLYQQRAAVAAFDLAVAQYRRTVLNAFQNVADALKAVQMDAMTLSKVKAQADAAKLSLDIARKRRALGDVNYLNLLYAQQAYYQAIVILAQSQATRFADTAGLFQALGGGWSQASITADPQPPYRAMLETLKIQLTSPFMLN
jgi:NodT family efflux transporter outer membrane factor (OMF) lipoprotein